MSVLGSRKAGKEAEEAAKRNAEIAMMEAEAQADAIQAERRDLIIPQRELKAQQRMSVAGRGGALEGTDLMAMIFDAEKMQLDQIELLRQRDLALKLGEAGADAASARGKAAKTASRYEMASTALSTAGQIVSLGVASRPSQTA
jgi:hypothetical protein